MTNSRHVSRWFKHVTSRSWFDTWYSRVKCAEWSIHARLASPLQISRTRHKGGAHDSIPPSTHRRRYQRTNGRMFKPTVMANWWSARVYARHHWGMVAREDWSRAALDPTQSTVYDPRKGCCGQQNFPGKPAVTRSWYLEDCHVSIEIPGVYTWKILWWRLHQNFYNHEPNGITIEL